MACFRQTFTTSTKPANWSRAAILSNGSATTKRNSSVSFFHRPYLLRLSARSREANLSDLLSMKSSHKKQRIWDADERRLFFLIRENPRESASSIALFRFGLSKIEYPICQLAKRKLLPYSVSRSGPLSGDCSLFTVYWLLHCVSSSNFCVTGFPGSRRYARSKFVRACAGVPRASSIIARR